MTHTEEEHSSYYFRHLLLFMEQQHRLLRQPFAPTSIDDTNDSVATRQRYSLRVRDAIPETTFKKALNEINMQIQREITEMFNQQSALTMATQLEALRWQPAQTPSMIMVPQKIEADSTSWLSYYPEIWPNNQRYEELYREVEALQKQTMQIKDRHQYYKSLHGRLSKLTSQHVQDNLVTTGIAKQLNDINDLGKWHLLVLLLL
ncbi:hypothetical protein BDF22DRAFT_681472 [Syncephalis plumigaleata]|nr:hypothetical protein BDF22DRAFT_681472 [Syncephalis plumigaleata]